MLGNFPDSFRREIAGQGPALRRAAAALFPQAAALSELASRAHAGVIFTGMGGSYAACYAPVTVLAGAGRAASMVDAAELLHYRQAMLRTDQVLVLVSQSGRSAEVVRLAGEVRDRTGRPLLVTVTNGTANPLAELADVRLDTAAGHESGPSTLTFAACLVTLAAVATALQGRSGEAIAAELVAAAEPVAGAVARLAPADDDLAQQLRRWLGGRQTLALVGRGTARAAAEMGALTLKESARVPAESLQSGQFRHGPLELAGAEAALIVVGTEAATAELDRRLVGDLVATGTAVLAIGFPGDVPPGAEGVNLPPLDRRLAPAAALVPIQLLAAELAAERGLRPTSLRIAAKVTLHE